jgi:hypothetical protein
MLLGRLDARTFELLPATALIGRDERCDVVLASEHSSARHAEIRWRANGWDVRDLGSRNGTSLDGVRLEPGVLVPLAAGAVLQFAVPEEQWRVEAMFTPETCLFDPATGARELPVDGRLGALSFDLDQGAWLLDGEPVSHGARIGERRAFFPVWDRSVTTLPKAVELGTARVRIVASRDLARIDLHVEGPTERVSLLERAWSIALYVLALERVADPAGGWVEVERLARRSGLDRKVLDVYLLRARDALVKAGVGGGEGIVEVRRGARRLGGLDVIVEQGGS